MFNHKCVPNVAWERNIAAQCIRYFAIRDIAEDEELCISYGSRLWFVDVDRDQPEAIVADETDVFPCGVDVFR